MEFLILVKNINKLVLFYGYCCLDCGLFLVINVHPMVLERVTLFRDHYDTRYRYLINNRERNRERERERERERGSEKERGRERDGDREKERQSEKEKEKKIQRNR